jgi:hypothetical protein
MFSRERAALAGFLGKIRRSAPIDRSLGPTGMDFPNLIAEWIPFVQQPFVGWAPPTTEFL